MLTSSSHSAYTLWGICDSQILRNPGLTEFEAPWALRVGNALSLQALRYPGLTGSESLELNYADPRPLFLYDDFS